MQLYLWEHNFSIWVDFHEWDLSHSYQQTTGNWLAHHYQGIDEATTLVTYMRPTFSVLFCVNITQCDLQQ